MADELYLIQGETLTAIADKTRALAKTTDKLTPEDIVYWLGRVKPLPQGFGSGEFTLNFETSADGALQEV